MLSYLQDREREGRNQWSKTDTPVPISALAPFVINKGWCDFIQYKGNFPRHFCYDSREQEKMKKDSRTGWPPHLNCSCSCQNLKKKKKHQSLAGLHDRGSVTHIRECLLDILLFWVQIIQQLVKFYTVFFSNQLPSLPTDIISNF